MIFSMTKDECDSHHMTVSSARMRGWGAGVVVFGLGAALAVGAMPAVADTTGEPTVAAPWVEGEALPATGLSSETVGFHAMAPVAQDRSALPKHAAEREIVDVTDFGADPTGVKDSAKAVNGAVEHAKSLDKPTTIFFPCGNYAMYPENAPKRELYVSNTVGSDQNYKTKTVGLLIEDMVDVIVEGNGSQLTFHGSQTEFAAIRSTDVTIRNLNTDWYAPGTLDLTVLASGTSDGHGYRDIQLPAGVNHTINGATATFTGETSPTTGLPYWTHEPSGAGAGYNQTRELATGLTLRTGVPLWKGSSAVSDLGNGKLRVSYNNAADPGGAGKVYEIRKPTRDTPGGLIWESERTSLENMKLHYLHGFGIVGQFSTDVAMDRITMRTDQGTGRQTAAFADFIQMSGVAGKVQITNSLFDNPHDDPINIHGTYVEVKDVDRAAKTVTLQYMHNETAGFPQFHEGDELRFVKKSTMLPAGSGTYTVTGVDGPTGKDASHSLTRMTVKVDGELPAGLAAGQFVAENLTYTPEVYIAGNTFQSVPTRGILVTTPREVLIERNIFDQMGMASIYISADAVGWYESSAVEDVTIRNNVFDRPTSNYGAIWIEPFSTEVVPGRTVHKNINIDANRFSLRPAGQLVNGKSVSNLDFTNNVVNHYAPTTPVDPQSVSSKPLFDFQGSADITIANNQYAPGFNLRANTAANMSAAEVNVAGDGVLVNEDNLDLTGVNISTLDPAMSWIRQDSSRFTAVNKDTVAIQSGANGLWASQNAATNMLMRKAASVGDAETVVKIGGATKSSYEEAGLVFYLDDDNYVAFQRKHAGGSPVLAVITETAGVGNENTQMVDPGMADIWLKLKRTGNDFTGSWSTDGVTFTDVGTVSNTVVGDTARTGLLTGGVSDSNTAFTYSSLSINGSAQPLFDKIVTPGPVDYVSELADPVWNGIDFGEAKSPLAWLQYADASVKQISTTFAPKEAGTNVQVIFNDAPAPANADGGHTFKLEAGPNVVEVNTFGADGVATQAYRWVVVSELPTKIPGAVVECNAPVDPEEPVAPTLGGPAKAAAGTTITVAVSCLAPGAKYALWTNAKPGKSHAVGDLKLAEVTAGADGAATVDVLLPASLHNGMHTLLLQQDTTVLATSGVVISKGKGKN